MSPGGQLNGLTGKRRWVSMRVIWWPGPRVTKSFHYGEAPPDLLDYRVLLKLILSSRFEVKTG